MRRITIKSRLYATAIGILIILLIIGFVANYYIHNALSNFDSMSLIKDINYSELQLRKLEKDFVNLETKNIEFYKNQHSSYQDNFMVLIESVKESIDKLKNENIIRNNKLNYDLNKLESEFSVYHKIFEKLVAEILEKGFKDYGQIGLMRTKIHAVEDMTDQYPHHPEFKISMLTLRRNEKDYLLRKDLKYLDKFKKNIDIFTDQIANSQIDKKTRFGNLLDEYYIFFEKVIESDVKLGLAGKKGYIQDLNQTSKLIEKRVSDIQKTISTQAREEVNQAITMLFIVSIILTVIIMTILTGVTRRILNSLKKLKKFIYQLGNGELPPNLIIQKNDEVGDMIKSINNLLENLRNTREFALEVGKGRLDKQINVFNNKGDLGGALVEMREQLLQLNEERAKNEEKEKKRNWANEGIAQFSDIMRRHDNNLKDMSYEILSRVINYIDANQGAIFILHNEKPDDQYLEKIAAVAYDRKKIAGDKIKLGKDMVGRVAFEKKEIYLKNVPEDYIKITSGLGFATPRQLFLAPIMKDNEVLGAVELASFNGFPEHVQKFIRRICDNLGTSISAIQVNEKTQTLLGQAQEQADEIASQEEELRQNMEEMQATQEEANRREEALRQELAVYKNSIATITVDDTGNILEANESAQMILGTTEKHIKNKLITSFIPDEKDKNSVYNMIRTAIQNIQTESFVKFYIEGESIALHILATAIQSNNNLEKIILLLENNQLSCKTTQQNTNSKDAPMFKPELNVYN